MKVYVDELPNCCGNCGFCCKDDLGYWCQAREVVYIADETLGEKRLQSCPLQSISDYTKQVRKEAFQEVIEILEEAVNYPRPGRIPAQEDYPSDFAWEFYHYWVKPRILKKIQGE